ISIAGHSNSSYTGTLAAGPGGGSASAGTIHVAAAGSTASDFTLDAEGTSSSTPTVLAEGNWRTVTVRNAAYLTIGANTSVAGLVVASGARVDVGENANLNLGQFSVSGNGTRVVNAGTLTVPGFAAASVAVGTTVSSGILVENKGTLRVQSDVVELANGVTLLEDGDLRGAANQADTVGGFTIFSGGRLSHTPQQQGGVKFTVTGTLDVRAGGVIDVAGRGLRGGLASGNLLSEGEAYSDTGAVVAGATGRAGGSHGGPGGAHLGTTNPVHGSETAPVLFGAGGATGATTQVGGNGGGLVDLRVGNLVLGGNVLADGLAGNTQAGGGAGGSIRIVITGGSFTGAGGMYARG
ncbi:MAG: hypothetical protein ACK4N5_26755, partial [Myxococcales bacterium]